MNRLFYLTTILGLLLIILNIFFDLSWIPELNDQSIKWLLTIISKASSTIGLALLLGNLTKLFNKKDEEDKAKSQKTELKSIIEQTVISKNFLKTLSDDTKRETIANLLTPDNNTLNKHSNIKEYLDTKTDKYLQFFNINFRTNYNIDVRVDKDTKTKHYYAKYKLTYRIYKINDKFEPITISFEKKSEIISTIIKHENQTLIKVNLTDYVEKDGNYQYFIPDEFQKFNFLVVERVIVEYGHPHWISLNWKSLTPIEGITFNVECKQGIIKEVYIFDADELYNQPDLSDDRKNLCISSHKWLDPHTGLNIIIADKSPDDDFNSSFPLLLTPQR